MWKEVALRAVADWQKGSRPHSRFYAAAMAMAAEVVSPLVAHVQSLADK